MARCKGEHHLNEEVMRRLYSDSLLIGDLETGVLLLSQSPQGSLIPDIERPCCLFDEATILHLYLQSTSTAIKWVGT